MSATHRIPKVDLPGLDEDHFVCYPRRGDSLSFYSKLYDRRFGLGLGWLRIPPGEAAAYMAERLGIHPRSPGIRRRASESAPVARPTGSSRCPAAGGTSSTTSSPSSSTGTIRRCSRTSSASTPQRARFASAASRPRAAPNMQMTRPSKTRSGSHSNLRDGSPQRRQRDGLIPRLDRTSAPPGRGAGAGVRGEVGRQVSCNGAGECLRAPCPDERRGSGPVRSG